MTKLFSKELNKEFSDKYQLFNEIKANKDTIIASKKIELKSRRKDNTITDNEPHYVGRAVEFEKLNEQIKGINFDDNYYYIVVNTTNILDSHKDLHANGIWNKTKKEQSGRVYLVWEHELTKDSIIVHKQDIELMVADIPVQLLDKRFSGTVEGLIYKFRKDKVIDATAKEWLEKGIEFEASVRMIYIDIILALNSDRDEDRDEFATYQKYYNSILNKSEFSEPIEYFWVVKEAKNVMESSMLMFGSNPVTGQIENKSIENELTETKEKLSKVETELKEIKQTIEPLINSTQKQNTNEPSTNDTHDKEQIIKLLTLLKS